MGLAKSLGIGAATLGVAGVSGAIAGAMRMNDQGGDAIVNSAVGTAGGAAAIAGAAAGAAVPMTALAALNRARKMRRMAPVGGMKYAALAGAAIGGIMSAQVVNRGLSRITHAPRRLVPLSNAMAQNPEGGIQGMEL